MTFNKLGFLSCNTIPITIILVKIKTIIITITISNKNSCNNSFFTITYCYYVSLWEIESICLSKK